jgi:hypothetical protein
MTMYYAVKSPKFEIETPLGTMCSTSYDEWSLDNGNMLSLHRLGFPYKTYEANQRFVLLWYASKFLAQKERFFIYAAHLLPEDVQFLTSVFPDLRWDVYSRLLCVENGVISLLQEGKTISITARHDRLLDAYTALIKTYEEQKKKVDSLLDELLTAEGKKIPAANTSTRTKLTFSTDIKKRKPYDWLAYYANKKKKLSNPNG